MRVKRVIGGAQECERKAENHLRQEERRLVVDKNV